MQTISIDSTSDDSVRCETPCDALKESVIRRNANGIRHMMNGDFRLATTSFLDALQDARCLLDQDDDNLEWMDTFSMAHQNFAAVEIDCCAAAESSQENMFAVYNRCLLIRNRSCFDDIFACSEDIIPATVLYNVGLSLHLNGLQQGNDAFIAKAQGAYSTAFAILKNMAEPFDAENLLLLLAILNNSAAIESRRFNTTKVSQHADLIKSIIHNDEFIGVLEDPMYDFFALALYFFLSPHMCQSAAPAA